MFHMGTMWREFHLDLFDQIENTTFLMNIFNEINEDNEYSEDSYTERTH